MTSFEKQESVEELCRWCGEKLIQPEGLCPKCDAIAQDIGREKNLERNKIKNLYEEKKDIFKAVNNVGGNGSDWLITLLLCFFGGFIGLHRFYTGNFVIGLFQAMTLGGFGFWTMIDFFLIITMSYKDGQGKPLVKRK